MKEELQRQLELIFEIMADDRFTNKVADFSWNMYNALLAKGFSEEQAMGIVVSMAKIK